MNRNTPQSNQPPVVTHSENHSETREDWTHGDPLWDVLDQASTRKPDAFFARNIVRATRQLSPPSLSSRLLNFLSSRRMAIGTMGAAACVCVAVTYQFWPTSPQTSVTAPTIAQVQSPQSEKTTTDLSELVIEETLLAAAEDPTIFTRDEVVTMLGL